jgi:hypothetical protein
VIANIAPYCLATGTASLLKTGTRTRLAATVTQTPSTAVPLALIEGFRYDINFWDSLFKYSNLD